MTASRPIGSIRGKDKVNRPGKPKERDNKLQWTNMAGRAASRPIAMAGRGIVEVEVQWARWARAFTQAVPSPWGNEGR